MKSSRRHCLQLAAAAAALPAVSRIAWPQAYPSRPITIVVGFVAGGPSDLLGRMVVRIVNALPRGGVDRRRRRSEIGS
jgi:tripartite-type tricarboxylate transporter receptor subunit TctC